MANPIQSRLAQAQQLMAWYRDIPTVDAVFVAGSVARGTADTGSDLEIDILWREPPSDHERRLAIDKTGAKVDYIADYEDDEWSERYHLQDLQVDISGFLTDTLSRFIDDVTTRYDPKPERQWLLAALQDGYPLWGHALLIDLKARLTYPDPLARAVIAQGLAFDPLWYYQRLADRHDTIMLHQVLARAEISLMTCLCGLNRLYLPHPDFKWAESIIGRMTRVPPHLVSRIELAFQSAPGEGLRIFQKLAEETIDLIRDEWPDLAP